MKTSDDLVSVVIPVYNSEKFLREAIDSVLNQTYKNIETIVVDDGSIDNSAKILKEYSEKINTISQPNQGLASALNSGIKKMKGKWFKWFSPDDVLHPNAIEILVNEANNQPENTIIYSNWELIDEQGNKLRNFLESNYNDLEKIDFNVRLLDGQLINVNTTLIPCSLFDKGCKIQELNDPVAIDYDFFLRAGILYDVNFYLVSQNLLKYRIHSEQLSHKKISQSLEYVQQVKSQVLEQLDESTRKHYQDMLKEYNDKKPVSKKTMDFGLKLASKLLPEEITDRMLVFYLNKIRRKR